MNLQQLQYYHIMYQRDRLMPIFYNNKLKGFITYYIGILDIKYYKYDPWQIIDDEPDIGTVCYIDQLITDKEKGNNRHSKYVFKMFIDYIKWKYPKVIYLKWARYKGGKSFIYNKAIREGEYAIRR